LLYTYSWHLSYDLNLANDITLQTVSEGLNRMASNRPMGNSKFAWFSLLHETIKRDFAHILPLNFREEIVIPNDKNHPIVSMLFNVHAMDALHEEPWNNSLKRLEITKRVFILLCDIEQFNYAEISKILNLPVAEVQIRLYDARHQFHQLLVEESK